jgi:enoyl-CoA hydratase/carnithine racemase
MAETGLTKEYASGLILFDILDESSYIGCITINNPSKRNAISRPMWLGLSNLLDDCLLNYKTLRVLILTGHGQISFCSGYDLSEKESDDIDHTIPNIRRKLLQFPIPIIAKINGYCLGGGLALAMNIDIRIASSNASFSIPAVKLGVPLPKDIIDRLIQLIGESHAKMILYTGDRISAQQAYSIGLIQYVCDNHDSLDKYVLDFARTLSRNAPLSIRSIKTMIENKNDELAIKTAIDACRNSNDMNEGRNAFREKREANFQGC